MKFLNFLSSIFICYLPGLIGGFFTSQNIYPWYDNLIKPSFNPPSWVFSPVWTVLYFLMGISLFLVLNTAKSKDRTEGIVFFAIQLFLNALWPLVFFGLHSLIGGVIVIGFLIVFIAISMIKFYKISKPAAYLLIPYLLWVCFAGVLNFTIYTLN